MGAVIKPNKNSLIKNEQLRDYQEKTIDILTEMDKGSFSTIVNLPTGAGKTKIAENFLFSVLEKNPKNKVLWLSDRNNLLLQAIESFKRDCPVEMRELSYQLICSKDIEEEKRERITDIDCTTNILFVGIRTLLIALQNESIILFYNWLKASQEGGKLYVVYDEAHHIGSDSAEHIFAWLFAKDQGMLDYYNVKSEACMIENYALIGLTATVYRGDLYLDAFDHWFKDGYDNEKGEIVHSKEKLGCRDDNSNNRITVTNLKELVEKGYLIEPKILKDEVFCNSTNPTEKEMEDHLIKRIKEEGSTWGKTIVFVKKRAFAEGVERRLRGVDLGTEIFVHISGTSSKDKQTVQEKKAHQRMVEEFKTSGKMQNAIMLTVDMVSEGFDVPDLNTVYLFAPICSPVLLRQRIGRVLRKPNDTKKAQVIWQEYSGGQYLSAEQYTDELKEEHKDKKKHYSYYRFLHLLELFGEDELADGVGYIQMDNEEKILVNKKMAEGYKQFYCQICNDRFTVIKPYEKENGINGDDITFEEYAKALEVSVTDLVAHIKIVCFALLSDVFKGKKTLIRESRSKIPLVSRENLEDFFDWVVHNNYALPLTIPVSKEEITNNNGQGQNNGMGKYRTLKEAIQCCYKRNNREVNPQKIYTEDLIIRDRENDDYFFKEMESARRLMKIGAINIPRGRKTKEVRKRGVLFGVKGELAFIGINKDGKAEDKNPKVRHICRNRVADENPDLIANALITRLNHLNITNEIVDDYAQGLKKALEQELMDQDIEIDDRLVCEFMMALGYADNNDLIRMQCRLFGGTDIPKLLQFVIYEKVYDSLYKEVSFLKDGKLSPNCQNKEELEEIYQEIIKDYCLSDHSIKGLHPVEDVIEDYRPYLKAVPYYQGIKPEFLCRLANWIADYHHSDGNYKFINPFGGSGANNMNFFTWRDTMPKQQVYNDSGVLNTTFYTVLKDQGTKDRLLEMLQEFHKVISEDDAKTPNEFLTDFITEVKELEEYNRIKGKVDEAFNYNSGDGCMEQKDRAVIEDGTESQLEEPAKGTEQCSIQEVEKRLYFIVNGIHILYHIYIKSNLEIPKESERQVRMAFIFLIYNTFSDRHFLKDCTIDHYAKFYANYEEWLDWGSEIFKNVEVKKGDALELMKNKQYDSKDTEWYLDIPYSGTDQSSYSEVIDEDSFIEALSGLEGHYAISSRINICLKEKKEEENTEAKKENESKSEENKEYILEADEKQKAVLYQFYSRFVVEGKDSLESILKENKSMEEIFGKKLVHISEEKKARYILIPFVKLQYIKRKDEESNKEELYKTVSSTPFDRRTIIRMISSVIYGNRPIEIMITDKDINLSDSPIRLVDGIGILPTFKTPSSYSDEPAVIIMKYEEFFEILQQVLYPEEYRKQVTSSTARFFSNHVKEQEKLVK